MNLYFVYKHVGVMPKLSGLFGKPLLASSLCAAAAYFTYAGISSVIASKLVLFVAIFVAVCVYLVAIFLVRGISAEDVKLLPKGDKIFRILNKLKLVKE
jgi:stage V sporulation protein B